MTKGIEEKIQHSMHFNNDDPRYRIRPAQQISSACTGALLTSLFMTPLDVVKTRLQVQQKSFSNKCFVYCNGLMDHLCPCTNGFIGKNNLRLNGTIDAVFKISKHEGIAALWGGLGPTLVLALPATVVYFVAYEQLRAKLKDNYMISNPNSTDIPIWIPLIAGASARIMAVSLVNPLELIRTKMQSQKLSYLEVGRAFKNMIEIQGMAGLFKGLSPTLFRDVPFSGIYWSCYESLKKYYNIMSPTVGYSFAFGAISGSVAAIVTTPFDVVKTHKQIEFGEEVLYSDNPQKNSVKSDRTIETVKKIYRTNGIGGLYAGVIPRLAKVAPACAIMIASFEYGKSFFYSYNIKNDQNFVKKTNLL